jgi:nitroreductase|tara:strand:- start:2895 stop:3551 length:657 start_codon:yes stop_codon:yes gene_type:complete
MNNWQEMIQKRHTTFSWSDKEVTKEQIQEILDDLYNYAPSKQAMMPYKIDIMDWSDPELRNEIFAWTHRDGDRPASADLGNPQTLAPWLLAFTPRHPVEDVEHAVYEGEKQRKFFEKMAHLEIGIASSFIVWSAESRGLSTGYCGCLNELGTKELLNSTLSPNDPDPEGVAVLLGIGYKDETNPIAYLDPRTGKKKLLPNNDEHNDRRPNPSVYMNWK